MRVGGGAGCEAWAVRRSYDFSKGVRNKYGIRRVLRRKGWPAWAIWTHLDDFGQRWFKGEVDIDALNDLERRTLRRIVNR